MKLKYVGLTVVFGKHSRKLIIIDVDVISSVSRVLYAADCGSVRFRKYLWFCHVCCAFAISHHNSSISVCVLHDTTRTINRGHFLLFG